MADIYEVIHPNEKFVDAATGGDDVLKSITVKWVEQGDGSYAQLVGATVTVGDMAITDIEGFDSIKGQKAMAESLPVVIASDQSGVDVSDRIGRLLGKMTNYDVLENGTITALDGTVEIVCAGMGTVGLGISGTWVGTIVAEIEVGDSVWDAVPLIENTLADASLSTSANGNWLLGIAGALTLRIRASAWTSGTATIYLNASSAASGVFLSRSLPTGLNAIGTVGVDEITLPTTIYNGQKTVTSAGTAEALASSQALISGVTVKALIDNTDKIYVGNSGVDSTNGLELDPGESQFIEVANLATVYIDSVVNSEGVSFIAT